MNLLSKRITIVAAVALLLPTTIIAQDKWTLQQCIDYAKEHNLQIQKSQVQEMQGDVSLQQYKDQLLPSLGFTMNQTVSYRPFIETMSTVHDGRVTSINNKITEQGSYGLNASWMFWNGNANRMNIQNQKLTNQQSALQTERNELSVQEQIMKLYISILYTTEAQHVAEKMSEHALTQWERGKQLLQNGKMARAEVTALEAQYRSSEYDIVNSKTMVANYKRQLKALLELSIDTPFDVAEIIPTEEDVMSPIPSAQSTYEQALLNRPEIRIAEISIEQAALQEKIAKAGYQPTLSLNGSIGDSHYTGSHTKTGEQMKTNLNASMGVNVQLNLFDQNRTKSAVAQARLQRVNSQLELQDQQNTLSSTIEEFWLNAVNNQQKFISARYTLASQQESYNQLNEQFKEGLKNIVDLLQGRDNLLNAEQNMLQSKYNTLLYINLLKFYSGEAIQ